MSDRQTTILVVEDSRDVRDVLIRLLQRSGYHVVAAINGQDALRHVQDQLPDLVLMDLSMPLMDGWKTLTLLREMPGGARLPVIAVTAHAMIGDREAVLAHGFDAYMSKPLDIRAFLDLVAQFVQR
jgi:two-component system, cell cycle response regulator DivK